MKIKRIAALMSATLLAVSCVSCSAEKIDLPDDESSLPDGVMGNAGKEENNQIPNPLTDVNSVEDINSRIGCSIKNIEGATDENYTVFTMETELGQYEFFIDEAKYTLRAAKTESDLSGVYTSDGLLGDLVNAGTITECDDGTYYEKWFEGDMQYSLYGINTTKEDFDTVVFFFEKQAAND